MNKIGIYQIRNLINHKIYIGGSKNIESRFLYHRAKLNRDKHDNAHLQNAWKKYGEVNFVFEILELCDQAELTLLEQHYIDTTGCLDRKKGYNIAAIANLPPMNEETKRKIGNSNRGKSSWIKGKHHSAITKEKIKLRVTANNKMRGKIGELHHFHGSKHTVETKKKMSDAKKGINNNHSSKAVVQKLNGVFVNEFASAKEAQRQTGIQSKNIAKCLNGERLRAGGYVWEYFNEVVSEDIRDVQ